MKVRLLCVLLALMVVMAGCSISGKENVENGGANEVNVIQSKDNSPTPPEPNLKVDDKIIPAVRGSFCWSANGTGQCADTISPPELIENQTPVTVDQGSELTISFEVAPSAGTLGVNQWVDGKPSAYSLKEGNKLTFPNEKGIYIYDVYARWDSGRGSASYAFVVEVK